MNALSCPMCALRVPSATAQAAPDMEHCPRCLARTGGALSIELVPAPAARQSSPWHSRAARLLGQLRPAATKR